MGEFDEILKGVPEAALVGDPKQTAIDQAVDLASRREAMELRSSLLGSIATQPDRMAKVVQLAGRNALSPGYVERNFQQVQGQTQVNDVDTMLAGLPRARAWLSNPVNAQVSSDSYEQLGLFEKF